MTVLGESARAALLTMFANWSVPMNDRAEKLEAYWSVLSELPAKSLLRAIDRATRGFYGTEFLPPAARLYQEAKMIQEKEQQQQHLANALPALPLPKSSDVSPEIRAKQVAWAKRYISGEEMSDEFPYSDRVPMYERHTSRYLTKK